MYKKLIPFLMIFLITLGGCISISSIGNVRKSHAKLPQEVKIYFSKKSIKKDYKIMTRYSMGAVNRQPEQGLQKIREKAAKDGCDGILIDSVFWNKTTSTIIIIPISSTSGSMKVSGIKFISENDKETK